MSDIEFHERLVCWAISKETEIRNHQYCYDDFEKEQMLGIIFKYREFLEDGLRGKGMFQYDRRNIWEVVFEWYSNQTTSAMYWRTDKRPEKLKNQPEETGKCTWPSCEIVENTQADHIIPKSVLSDRDFENIGGTYWDLNGQWLCSFHNRLKTDSIMLGLVMLCFK